MSAFPLCCLLLKDNFLLLFCCDDVEPYLKIFFSVWRQLADSFVCVCVYLLFKGISMTISIHPLNLSALTSISEDIPYDFLTIYVPYLASNKQLARPPIFSSQSLQFLPFSVHVWPALGLSRIQPALALSDIGEFSSSFSQKHMRGNVK